MISEKIIKSIQCKVKKYIKAYIWNKMANTYIVAYSLCPQETNALISAMIVREGDSKIYGRKVFKYKMMDLDEQRKAYEGMFRWAYSFVGYIIFNSNWRPANGV